jgi:hypothetical protein
MHDPRPAKERQRLTMAPTPPAPAAIHSRVGERGERMMEDLASIAARVLANDRCQAMTAIEVRTAEGKIIKIHPSLNALPLMDKDEMKSLVRSIKKNKLLMPIMVDVSGVLIDGRCRLIACELAGVPPRFETLPEDVDPVDWIYDANALHQSYGKQQKAMFRALLENMGSRALLENGEEEPGDTSLARARILVEHAGAHSDLVKSVCDGICSLAEALEQLKRREDEAAEVRARAVQLRRVAPALADRVSDGELSLDEALSQSEALADLAERIRAEHQGAREAYKRSVEHAMAAGDLLIEAKAKLTHGQWGPWLEAKCEMSDRTARLYMRAARGRGALEAKTATVADLTLRDAMKLLAAPAVLDEDDAPTRLVNSEQERKRAVIEEALPLILQLMDENERAALESRVRRHFRDGLAADDEKAADADERRTVN